MMHLWMRIENALWNNREGLYLLGLHTHNDNVFICFTANEQYWSGLFWGTKSSKTKAYPWFIRFILLSAMKKTLRYISLGTNFVLLPAGMNMDLVSLETCWNFVRLPLWSTDIPPTPNITSPFITRAVIWLLILLVHTHMLYTLV